MQLRQKDTCTLLDMTMTEYRTAYIKLLAKGEIFVEKINGGYANRIHWIFKKESTTPTQGCGV